MIDAQKGGLRYRLEVWQAEPAQLVPMPKIWSIQYLRAAAALMVVMFHACGMVAEYFRPDWPSFGAAGVDIFFVISGFIMWTTTARDDVTPSSFIKHRIVRIVPLYWAITLFLYLGWIVFRDRASLPPLADLTQSLLFVPYFSARSGEIQPLLIAGWTLNFEMFFYAVFACGLLMASRHRVFFVGILLCGLVSLRIWTVPSSAIALTYTSPLLLEFAVGCLIGIAYENKMLPRSAVAVFLIAVGFGVLLAAGSLSATDIAFDRFVCWGLPAALIVAGALGVEPLLRHWRLPALLGDASYSIYLTHGIALAALKNAVLFAGGASGLTATIMFVIASCICSTVTGVAVYYLIEKPLGGFFRPLIAGSGRKQVLTERPAV